MICSIGIHLRRQRTNGLKDALVILLFLLRLSINCEFIQAGILPFIIKNIDSVFPRIPNHEGGAGREHRYVNIEYVFGTAGIPHGLPLVFLLIITGMQRKISILIAGMRLFLGPDKTPAVYIDISPGLVGPGLLAIRVSIKALPGTWFTPDNLRIRIAEPFNIDTGALDNGYVTQICW